MNHEEMMNHEVINEPARQPAKGLALAGFLCGLGSIVCCTPVAGVVGIILSQVAKKKGNASRIRKAGVVCGIVGIVFSVLISVIMMALAPSILAELDPGLFGDTTVESVTNPPAHKPEPETTRELTVAEMLVYTSNGDGTYAVSVLSDALLPAEVTIPARYRGGLVTKIAPGGFMGQYRLRKISLPETVTSISGAAFQGCRNLIEVDFPDGLTHIGPLAFSECRSLERIQIPEGITEIPNSCFAMCVSLVDVSLPSTLTRISDQAFLECEQLSSVALPDSVTYIGERAFRESMCSDFKLPAELEYVGHEALSIRYLATVLYPGTMEEWENKVVKEEDWYVPIEEGDKLLYVICSDGTIDLRNE